MKTLLKNCSIKILGKDIKVRYISEDSDINMDNRYGFANIFKGEIVLNRELSEDILLHTLLHEVIHFWNEDLALGLNADDEESHDTIDRIVTALIIFCKENGIDLKKILYGLKQSKEGKGNGKRAR